MEFKFRAGQASTQSSTVSYFTEQALRAGYWNNYFGRRHEIYRNPNEFFGHPSNMPEAIQREFEKERIRQEIIAADIARKRVLEAEVRREMMMERDMGLRRTDGFSFLSHRFEPRLPILHQSDGRSLEERIALSLEERLGHSSRREIWGFETVAFQHRVEPKITESFEIGGFETVPFQRRVEPKRTEVRPLPEVSKGNVVLLGKPDANISGVKRKAVTPPATGADELALVVSKKKLTEEWSCAICQVTATSEHGLNEHLEGKRHKGKEAALRAQRTGKNFGIGLFPKKTTIPTKLADITDIPRSEQGGENERNLRLLRFRSTESPKKNDKPLRQMMHNADDLKKENGKAGEHKKNKFTFWCEMCQAGAFSEKVMDNHKRGKKHMGRLQELNQNHGAALGTQKAKDSEAVAEEETRDALEKADGVTAEGHDEAAKVADNSSI